jgi:hypothetical protein
MPASSQIPAASAHADDIPLPIVTLSRWFYLVCLAGGFLLQQPLLTTVVLLVALLPLLWGRRWNLFAYVGRRLYGDKLATAPREDRRLIRFNNLILATMLGVAQLFFLLGLNVVGWALALAVGAAVSAALAGYCVGCALYFQLKLHRYRFFGAKG